MTRNVRAQAAGAARSDRPRACLWREPLDVAQQTLELAVVQAALDLGCGADAHAPQLDEARSGGLVERVSLAIRRERVLVQLGRRFAPHHLRGALEQLQAHVSGYVALGLGHECVKGVTQRA